MNLIFSEVRNTSLKRASKEIPKRGLETASALFIDKTTRRTPSKYNPEMGMLGVITNRKRKDGYHGAYY
jgi:hypothetical protein